MIDKSWIKLYRKIRRWPWYTDSVTVHVFIELLLCANTTERSWNGIMIKPGELVTSVAKLSDALDLSTQQVRTALTKLEKCNTIIRDTTNRCTLVKIVNYCNYQGKNFFIHNQVTNEQQMTNKSLTTTKEYKNNKNKENIKNYYPHKEKEDSNDENRGNADRYVPTLGLLL